MTRTWSGLAKISDVPSASIDDVRQLMGLQSVNGLWTASNLGHLIVTEDGCSLEVWDLARRACRIVADADQQSRHGQIMSATLAADGTNLRWLDIHGQVWSCSHVASKPIQLTSLRCNGVWSSCFSASGEKLFVARRDERIQMLDGMTGDVRWEGRVPSHSCRPTRACFTPDETRVVTFSIADEQQRIRVWNASTGEIMAAHLGRQDSAGVATDDRSGFAVTYSGASEFDLCTGECQRGFESLGNHITAIAVHRPTALLLLGTEDGTVFGHDLGQPYQRPKVLVRHASSITHLAISRCGRQKVAASHDGMLCVW